ncbi:DUF1338 domain-containing protein [Trinickia acidisoli]|uniref:DUF1338 domain-containing protein n=1 Tax=Trinickia acidisoli TaxID=2767482 RepID=UPI001A8C12D0|nr:DUF1338 domain-containing protein [Trinickia acidisoli]
MNGNLDAMLAAACGSGAAQQLVTLMNVPPSMERWEAGIVTRAELAQALNMALFAGLLDRVPTGRAYTDGVAREDGRVQFDHGALRTVRWPHCGALPPGEAAFTRILKPLGYRLNGTYPLDRIKMTGRSYAHLDAPEHIAQFFVSELHPERFSSALQQAVTNVVGSSADPLTPRAVAWLAELERDAALPLADACALLPILIRCFDRQHAVPRLADYLTLLAESAEMAWIATEGNAFNHATDRVSDVFAVADAQRELGRPIKEHVEVSKSGRVKQTAFQADPVVRVFLGDDGSEVRREVPGSFYEFITRDTYVDAETGRVALDLGFDAGNATGIFKMTAAA